MGPGGSHDARPDRIRLDKWLWFARVAKSRSIAADLIHSGYVRINGVRADAASRALRVGDTLTIALPRAVLVLRVKALGTRRGPAPEARSLYDDLSAPQQMTPSPDEL